MRGQGVGGEEGGRRGVGGCTRYPCIAVVCMTIWDRPSHPYKAGTEHVGFSPTRQTSRAPSAKRREVFGESRGR